MTAYDSRISRRDVTGPSLLGLLPAGATVQGTARFRGEELIGQPEDKLRRIRGAQISLILQEPL